MSIASVEYGVRVLRDGQLVIAVDDVNTRIGVLVGMAENVSPQKVNLMTKIGKGLIYTCISERKANALKLPFMVATNPKHQLKKFTVSDE